MLARLICGTFAGLWLGASLALSGDAYAVSEENFAATFSGQVLPSVMASPKQGFTGVGGVPLAYRVLPGDGHHGGLVFISGYSEGMLKNAEVLYDFQHAGYTVYALDMRGMGESGRLLPNPRTGFVETFGDYADDLERFVKEHVVPRETGPLLLLSHSMGGLVSAEMLARPGNSKFFKAVVLSSPMLGIQTPVLPAWWILQLARFNVWRGAGRDYVPGGKDYDPEWDDAEHSYVTHSVVRAQQTTELYRRMPELRIGGQSNQWVMTSLEASLASARLAPRIEVPMQIYQALEDVIVTPAAQAAFCSAAPRCQLIPVAGARHEILQEVDAVRQPVIEAILRFFAAP